MAQKLGWWDVARAFVPEGATLTFKYDDTDQWEPYDLDPPVVATVERRLDSGAVARCGTIPTGDEATDVSQLLAMMAGCLDRPDQYDPESEMGEAERAVYRRWSEVARQLLGR